MGNPLAELGMSGSDRISLDHALALTVSAGSIQEPLRRALLAVADSSRETSRTLRIVGLAAAAYLVCAGVARVVEASGSAKRQGRPGDGGGGESGA